MKRPLILTVTCLLLGFLSLPAQAAQICSSSIPYTSPDDHFTINKDGTASDKTTGLMWMRCSLGQTWNGRSCSGEAKSFSWAEGLKAAVGYQFGGHSDWRLPNKNELESIVENRCYSPAINTRIFPDTPAAYFWTSSPYAGAATGAWSVDFGYGPVNASVKAGKVLVRLVRDLE